MKNLRKFDEFLDESDLYSQSVKKTAMNYKNQTDIQVNSMVAAAKKQILILQKQQDAAGDDKNKWAQIQALIDKQKLIIDAATYNNATKVAQPKKN